MTPTDATNLLLALMYDGELTNCHDTVRRLRQATFYNACQHKRGQEKVHGPNLAPHRFLRTEIGSALNLGATFDAMFDWFVRYGTLEEEPEAADASSKDEDAWPYYATNISLKVEAPGHHCTIHIDAFETIWDLNYRWKSDEELAYDRSRLVTGTAILPHFDIFGGEYISTTRAIYENGLLKVADVLRDAPYNYDACAELRTPYDSAPMWRGTSTRSNSDSGETI